MKPEQFEMLAEAHYASLYRFALSLARQEAEACDLVQQTYFQLATRGGQIREPGKAKSWLFTTLRREFYAMRRQSGRYLPIDEREQESVAAPEDVELEAIAKADAALVFEALSAVPEVFRAPLSLYYFEDFGYREIAEILEVPIGTVMSRLSRGKAELRVRLASAMERGDLPENVVRLDRRATG